LNRDRLSIDFISALGMPPIDFVHLAADLGCGRVGIALTPITANPHGYPGWSLRNDPQLRRELVTALRQRSTGISIGEGFLIRSGAQIDDMAAELDLMAELGAERVNVVAIDPDRARMLEQLHRFAEMSGERGMGATIEFMPVSTIPDLASGLAVINEIGNENLKLVIDCMHLCRSGGTAAELATCERAAIGYLQVCDVPTAPSLLGYGEEAKHHRLPPGEGELPIAEILAATPSEVPIGIEIPQLSLAEQGVGAAERLGRTIRATCRLFEELGSA
jgi:sugar phosphate isomerase/epimerase